MQKCVLWIFGKCNELVKSACEISIVELYHSLSPVQTR